MCISHYDCVASPEHKYHDILPSMARRPREWGELLVSWLVATMGCHGGVTSGCATTCIGGNGYCGKEYLDVCPAPGSLCKWHSSQNLFFHFAFLSVMCRLGLCCLCCVHGPVLLPKESSLTKSFLSHFRSPHSRHSPPELLRH